MTQADTEAPEAKKTELHAMLEVEVRLQIPVPMGAFEGWLEDGKVIDELREGELREVMLEDTDRLPNAVRDLLENAQEENIYVSFEEQRELLPRPKVEFYKPADGELYTLPIPNFISGNVVFTDEGIESVEHSPVNKLTNEQLAGAYIAARRIWGLRGMHHYQHEQMAEYISELQWGMLARPSLHVFRPRDIDTEGNDGTTCLYCGNAEPGHLSRSTPKDD